MPDVSTVFDRLVDETTRAFRAEVSGDDVVDGLVHVEVFTVPPDKDRRVRRVMEATTVEQVCSAVEEAAAGMSFELSPTGWTATDYGARAASWSRA